MRYTCDCESHDCKSVETNLLVVWLAGGGGGGGGGGLGNVH